MKVFPAIEGVLYSGCESGKFVGERHRGRGGGECKYAGGIDSCLGTV